YQDRYRRQLREREFDGNYGAYDDDLPYRPRLYRDGRPVIEDPYGYEPGEEYAYPPDEAFPEAPAAPVRRGTVERRPLDDSGDRQAAVEEPDEPAETGTVNMPAAEEPARPLDPAAQPSITFGVRDDVAALQVLLDRSGSSPGVIDGRFGS